MGKADYWKAGDHNSLCSLCGFKYKFTKLKRTWEGHYVCPSCFEPRHPQEFVRDIKNPQTVEYTLNQEPIFI